MYTLAHTHVADALNCLYQEGKDRETLVAVANAVMVNLDYLDRLEFVGIATMGGLPLTLKGEQHG